MKTETYTDAGMLQRLAQLSRLAEAVDLGERALSHLRSVGDRAAAEDLLVDVEVLRYELRAMFDDFRDYVGIAVSEEDDVELLPDLGPLPEDD